MNTTATSADSRAASKAEVRGTESRPEVTHVVWMPVALDVVFVAGFEATVVVVVVDEVVVFVELAVGAVTVDVSVADSVSPPPLAVAAIG